MSYEEFQKHFEETAEIEQKTFDKLPTKDLIAKVKAKEFGTTYQIWYALARKARVEDVGWLFFDVLESEEEYLTRYHCAAALLSLFNPFPGIMKPEKLSGREAFYVDQHLEEMKKEMIKRIGPKK